jgi:hypothetical protein
MFHVHLFDDRLSYNIATVGRQISSSESITTQQRTVNRYHRKVISKRKCGLSQKCVGGSENNERCKKYEYKLVFSLNTFRFSGG